MYLEEIYKEARDLLDVVIHRQIDDTEMTKNITNLMQDIGIIKSETPRAVYDNYSEFFESFNIFCGQCLSYDFYVANIEMFVSSLELFLECLDAIDQECPIQKCICCGNEERVRIPSDGENMLQCSRCGAIERDRELVSLLKERKIQDAAEGTKIIHFAPTKAIAYWMVSNCPHIDYQTAKSYTKNSSKDFLQDISIIPNQQYDVIINPPLFEGDVNGEKIMFELKKMLKKDGKIVLFKIDSIQEENLKKESVICKNGSFFIITKSEDVTTDFGTPVSYDIELCNNGPLVSVILPCYNHEKFVGRAIESVINQSYKNIEILVADDASTDNTVEVIKKYSSFLKAELYFEKNKGGREIELKELAQGRYIALMHSDDVWEPDKIALQVEYMEKHPECGVCLTWCKYVDEEMNEIENNTFIKANRESTVWMRYFWSEGNVFCNPSSLVRREMAWEYPQYGSICRQLPDFYKWVYMIQKTNIHIVPRTLVKMRRINNVQNVSSSTEENILRHSLEEGNCWMWIIRDMEKDFFVKTFRDLFVNSDVMNKEQVKCEKYFLLLGHKNAFVQNSAFLYLSEVFNEIRDVLATEYSYTKKEIAEDMLRRGLAPLLSR